MIRDQLQYRKNPEEKNTTDSFRPFYKKKNIF